MENSVDTEQFERWFRASEDAHCNAQTEATRARDYVDGNQLTTEERNTLQKRGQPPVVSNRIRKKINWLKGLEIKQRTDPKAFPRTPQHEQDAESVTDAIRYVCDDQNWDQKRTDVYDNMLIEGFGGVEIIHQQNAKGEVDVVINHYPWDRLWYDPHSRRADFSDARYKGVVIWMDEADFKAQFPDAKAGYDNLFATSKNQVHEDKPDRFWVDAERKRVRVLLVWYREGQDWKWCQFIRGTKLAGGDSPYVDEDGASVCPLIMQSAYVGRDNDRYGEVRDMFDPQDEINKRRSRALFESTSRQTLAIKGALDSNTKLKAELKKPDGHIEINSEAVEEASRIGIKPFEILPTNDMAAAQFALLEDAKNEIELLGANSALAGETGESASGRAVLARQQGGMVEIAPTSDRLHQFTRAVYEQIWLRIRQFWTEERWVRVTDDESNVRFVGLNQPITLAQALSEMPEEQAMEVAMREGLGPNDPRLGMAVGVRNNVTQLEVDIVLEEVPDRVTLQGEVFEALLKYGPSIPPAVLIKADPTLPAKKKEELLEALSQPPAPSPQEQIEMQQGQADVAKTMAEAAQVQAETGLPLAAYG